MTHKDLKIPVALSAAQLELLDEWILLQSTPMTRPEALSQIAATFLQKSKLNRDRYLPAVEAYLARRTTIRSSKKA